MKARKSRIELGKRVVARTSGEDLILLSDTRAPSYWRLNAQAKWILFELLEGRTPRAIASDISTDTGKSSDAVLADVKLLMRSLRRARLITLPPGIFDA